MLRMLSSNVLYSKKCVQNGNDLFFIDKNINQFVALTPILVCINNFG